MTQQVITPKATAGFFPLLSIHKSGQFADGLFFCCTDRIQHRIGVRQIEGDNKTVRTG